ncbi:hypothetical protein Pmani_009866 [Petrolisthes manimaculis]|uniref:Uncharacterized protein n=1 Tax=Petrolisthes manimaculis TaxID=1843537 RepID=A0AAE1Q3A6_9EUCA|nr:hypothetical protein Pmani_009866 [Petrolisthes manimaculis]
MSHLNMCGKCKWMLLTLKASLEPLHPHTKLVACDGSGRTSRCVVLAGGLGQEKRLVGWDVAPSRCYNLVL